SIFINEAKSVKRSLIQNKTLTPKRMGAPTDILKGIETVPPLHAFVLTTPKPKSNVILRGPADESEEEIDPILSSRPFALGTTAAWTSDLAVNWGKDWVQWSQFQAFVKQLLIDTQRVEQLANLRMQAFAEGGKAMIQVEDYAPDAALLQVK